MAECLRGVAELSFGDGVPFLAEQSDVVAQGEEAVEQGGCLGLPSGAVEGVDKPEGTGEEHAFAGGQPSSEDCVW